jgi:hypothetical protein
MVKDGQPLTLELVYSKQAERELDDVYQDELRKVGIGLNLRLVTPETLFKLVMDRNFSMAGWVGRLLFPNPETSFGASWPIRRTTTTSRDSRTTRRPSPADAVRQRVRPEEARAASSRTSTASSPTPISTSWVGRAVPAHRYWNSSVARRLPHRDRPTTPT